MIQFDSRNSFYKHPFGSIASGSSLTFRIAAGGGVPAAFARLVLKNEETGAAVTVDGAPEILPGAQEILPGGHDIFEFSPQIEETGLYFYHFEVIRQDGETEQTPDYQLTVYSADYTTPDWLKSGVMYQIFPDRFARSGNYRAPRLNKNYISREDWGGIPNHEPDEKGIVRNNDFFGGNLRGIIEKLGYLEELGVTAIYLNPVFEAYSNHRYDTADFRTIDPILGTEEDFRELCKKAAEKGIRIILDGVFNHTGSDSLYFNKNGRYPEPGAYQSKDSPYYKWYRFTEFPDQYESWWGIDTLPGVNETEPSYLDFIVRSEDSVIKHWLRCGASGYRLDVADELPDEFLEALRAAVKEIRPDGAVIGEVWEDASNKVSYGRRRKYFQGKQLDSVMNYPLKNAVIDFLTHGGNGAELERVVDEIRENYPGPAFRALMNILGTHDTERILTVLAENSRDDGEARQKLFLALLIVSFMPGIPCVYYGDEIGMKGGKDPFNRMCFDRDRGDPAILRFYRRLFAFRRKIDELEDYLFQPRSAEGDFYSFVRIGEKGRLVVAAKSGGICCSDGNADSGGVFLLNLGMAENEYLKDFFISGSVSYDTQGVFRIGENSGVAAWIGAL
ncbi:MAG TPA: glycoside hydrolase family 13 protein [Anaerovoracaceae bacterium]|nr:glycoside hydrolase family 13 protein [Anaerovoracaceae bacterium]